MSKAFSENLAALRKGRALSQRETAAGLGVSQALLSHYENGAREPGLDFIVRVCDYFGVTADFLLGRTARADTAPLARELSALADALGELEAKARTLAEDVNR